MSTAVQDLDLLKPVREWTYQTSKTVMLPYSPKHTAVWPPDFLEQLYAKLIEDGTLHTIFPGMNLEKVEDFVGYLSKVKGLVICCLKTETKPDPIGFGWLSEVDRIKGSFGFGFFKDAWKNRVHVDLSFQMLAYWFDTFDIQNLYGTTLNPIAKNYSKRFGFANLCVLPGFFDCQGVATDGSLIVLRKDVFLRYHNHWKETRG